MIPTIYSNLDYDENGAIGTATKTTTTSIDFKVDKADIIINGGQVLYKDAAWGDYISAQVIDIDNVLGYGANTVLKEFIHKRYLHDQETSAKITVGYASLIPVNTYLRLKYVSVGTVNDVKVAVNYYLHHKES